MRRFLAYSLQETLENQEQRNVGTPHSTCVGENLTSVLTFLGNIYGALIMR